MKFVWDFDKFCKNTSSFAKPEVKLTKNNTERSVIDSFIAGMGYNSRRMDQ